MKDIKKKLQIKAEIGRPEKNKHKCGNRERHKELKKYIRKGRKRKQEPRHCVSYLCALSPLTPHRRLVTVEVVVVMVVVVPFQSLGRSVSRSCHMLPIVT